MGLSKKFKKTSLYRQVFGYDLFISYSRIDSMDYAYQLANNFIGLGYECFIDQLTSTTPGKKLPEQITDAIKKSKAFIIIGSEGSQNSYAISEEIQVFLDNRKNQPFIPITIEKSIFN